jgi:uncharacterized protein YycO
MRGDILLYRTGGILKDRIVCAYTGGPFCHCEIELGDGTSVGAHSEDGITRKSEALLDRKVVISLQEHTTPERIEAGIAWVLQHVGEPFSWASVADLIVPTWLSTLIFRRDSLYNCANLIAKYLEITGGLDLAYGKCPPMILSPNDIARAAGLLPVPGRISRAGAVRFSMALIALVPARRVAVQAHGTTATRHANR